MSRFPHYSPVFVRNDQVKRDVRMVKDQIECMVNGKVRNRQGLCCTNRSDEGMEISEVVVYFSMVCGSDRSGWRKRYDLADRNKRATEQNKKQCGRLMMIPCMEIDWINLCQGCSTLMQSLTLMPFPPA